MLGRIVLCFLVVSTACQRLRDSCPPPVDIQMCEMTCLSDQECRGDYKCCQTACGGTACIPPVTSNLSARLIEKLGRCPNPRTGRWICSNRCTDDTDCPTKLKCCKNRCGANACLVPLYDL